MKKFAIAIVAILTVFLSQACSIDQLEHMIIRSDLSSVKNIISEISVDQETKSQLIELASDIIIKRLKDKELINIERLKDKNLENFKEININSLSDFFSEDELEVFNHRINLIKNMIGASATGMLIGIGMFFSPLITDNKTPITIGATLAILGYIGALGFLSLDKSYCETIIEEACQRINTLYNNAIEIKHILHRLRTTTGLPKFRSARLRKLQKSWQQ
jgi:hypothetical protein